MFETLAQGRRRKKKKKGKKRKEKKRRKKKKKEEKRRKKKKKEEKTKNQKKKKKKKKGKLSLLNLLDEESSFPSATDDTLITKFHDNHAASECYEKPQGLSGLAKTFIVVHYAGKVLFFFSFIIFFSFKFHTQVTYTATGFLDKNVDTLNEQLINLFQQCTCKMTSSWFEKDRESLALRGTLKKGNKPPTVSGQFRVYFLHFLFFFFFSFFSFL